MSWVLDFDAASRYFGLRVPLRLTPVAACRMSGRFFARVLFALALLAQALVPVSTGRAISAANGATMGPLCAVLHGVEQATAAGAGADQAPKSDHSHRHGLCSYCQIGSSAPPFEPRLAPIALLRLTWTRPVFRLYADVIVVFHGNRNAPARAPPSFA